MPIVGSPSTTAELILDPVTEDASNVEVQLTDDNNYGLTAHSYPTPPLAAQWASSVSTEGAVLASQKHENRVITISVEAVGLGALYDLEQKLTKLYREGGTLKRTYSDGREITFDVLTLQDFDATFEQLHHLGGVTPVTINLIGKPYGRGAEQTLTDHVETTLPVLVFTEATIPGDMPALARLVVDNDSGTYSMTTFMWGIQSRYYDSAATAALFYQAESCALLSTAATAAGPAGASGSGSNVAQLTSFAFASTYQGLVNIGTSATAQTHVGTFRVYARIQIPIANTGTVSVRAVWSRYVGASEVTNTPVTLPVEGQWVVVDLGLVSIPQARKGTQGWLGRLEAASTVTTDDINLDWIALLPVDEGSGIASTNVAPSGGQIEVSDTGVLESGTGGRWREPSKYEGDYLRLPPSGPEARTLRTLVKLGSSNTPTGVATAVADDYIEDISARLYVTPRYLVVPES